MFLSLGNAAAVICGVAVMAALLRLQRTVFPLPPPPFDPTNKAQMAKHIESAPFLVKCTVLVSHALGACTAGMAHVLINSGVFDTTHLLRVGCIFLVMGWFGLKRVPYYPKWFGAVDLVMCYVPACYAGAFLAAAVLV